MDQCQRRPRDSSMESAVLGIREAAAFLGVHEQTIRRLARRGAIPCFKVGRDWRFRRESLRLWEEGQQGPHRCTVLVVDDDQTVSNSLAKIVTRLGCNVRQAANAPEGLTIVADEAPDLILLDLLMPGLDGLAFLAELRKTEPTLPVVISTGYPEYDLVPQTAQFAPILLLGKPVEPDLLERTMRSLVADRMACAAGGEVR